MTTQPAMDQSSAQDQMLRIISGFWIARAVYVTAKLSIPDLLEHGPKSAAELAAETKTHAQSLYRVLRALASVGVLAEAGGKFALTPLSETLQTNRPGSLRAFALTELGEEHYPAWGELLHSVKTGEIAFDHHFGMDIWAFFSQNSENAKIFNDAMSGVTAAANEAIVSSYDFSGIKKLVDVGGGHGQLLASILEIYPSVSGVVFDAPHVVVGANERIRAAQLSDRCETVGGDFFAAVPGGADGYILKWIIHDWDEEKAIRILTNCRRAIAENGRLLLVEAVIPQNDEPHFGKFIDLNMLVMTGGRERTEAEFKQLFQAAGFALTRVVETPSPFSVIEGRPA